MKKVIFGIFAHPDDEAFGPSASLLNEVQSGNDVHLILITDGAAGTNCDQVESLAKIRLKEWQKSAKLIGAKNKTALHYADGELSNNLYHEICEKINQFIEETINSYRDEIEVDFITFESGGISGHLDHIAVHFMTTFAYLQLRKNAPQNCKLNRLKYYCLPEEMVRVPNTGWLYMPAGKSPEMIDETFNYSEIKDKKLEIMKAHHSQREDMKRVLEIHTDDTNKPIWIDHFIYFKG